VASTYRTKHMNIVGAHLSGVPCPR